MYYLLDENKNVVESTLEEWCDYTEGRITTNYKHVGDEKVNGYRVSTIFIGLNHGCKLHDECDSAPTVFETAVFNKEGNVLYMDRHVTYHGAEVGHKTAIEWVKNKFKEDD